MAMNFNMDAIRPGVKALFVTQGGKTVTMKIANMSQEQIRAALMRPDNKSALAPGWTTSNGHVVRSAATTQPVTQPTPTVNNPAVTNNPIANIVETPVLTGPTQLQTAQAVEAARLGVADWNAQLAELQANNMGKYNTQMGLLKRDVLNNKQGYNAQSAAAGFRKSGGVRTNNMAVDAGASQTGEDIYKTVGKGAIDSIQRQKTSYLNNQLQNLFNTYSGNIQSNIFGGL